MNTTPSPARKAVVCALTLAVVLATMSHLDRFTSRRAALAADSDPGGAPAADHWQKLTEAAKRAVAALAGKDQSNAPAEAKPVAKSPTSSLSVWELYQKGGVLMYPITFVSFVVVCFGIERFLGLRRRKILPKKLSAGLRKMIAQPSGLDVRLAYRLCQRFPSSAANVIRVMLLKVGRPDAELEQAVAEATEREASRLYYHVRWLNLSMSVAPMLGLLGTVQGMIIVFMGASQLAPGANKAAYMAEGIYLKLVCTFAGLIVAIPAAVLAHLFEARIQKLMNDVEDLVLELLPQVERFEGRVRVRHKPPNQGQASPTMTPDGVVGEKPPMVPPR